MSYLLNRYLGKISSAGVLFSPPGEGNGSGNGGSGGDSNADSQTNGNGAGDDDDGGGDDDDDLSADLGLGEDVDENDFDLGESTGYQQTEADKQAAKELGESLEAMLEGFGLADDTIPDDFDVSDPKQLRDVIAHSNKQAIQSTLKMVVPIINHALGLAGKQMKHHMDSTANGSKNKSAAVEAFRSLGIEDKAQMAMGRTVFAQALKASKGDTKKATTATRRAFQAMGITLKGTPAGKGGNRSSGNGNSTMKEGDDALNSLFS